MHLPSQLWRPKAQDKGVGRAVLPPRLWAESLLASSWLLAVTVPSPGCSLACSCVPPICASVTWMSSPLRVPVSTCCFSLVKRTPVTLGPCITTPSYPAAAQTLFPGKVPVPVTGTSQDFSVSGGRGGHSLSHNSLLPPPHCFCPPTMGSQSSVQVQAPRLTLSPEVHTTSSCPHSSVLGTP